MKKQSIVLILIILFIVGCATKAPVPEENPEDDLSGKVGLTILPKNKTIEITENESFEENKTIIEPREFENNEVTKEKKYEFNAFVLDAGEGEAILIQTPEGKNLLFDCGPEKQARNTRLKLESIGVKEIDTIIISNGKDDYIGGCNGIIQAFNANKVYYNEKIESDDSLKEIKETIDNLKIEGKSVRKDMKLEITEDTTLEIFIPSGKYYDSGDNSIISKITFNDFSILMTGDCGKGCERRLLEKDKERLKAKVLKLGRHGSGDATTQLFLDAVNPSTTIITGIGNRIRNIPSIELIKNLRKNDINIFRTEYDGIITISSNGTSYSVEISKGVECKGQSYTSYNDCTYVIHSSSNLFMPFECEYADDILPKNRVCFKTLREAEDKGFEKHRKCDSYWIE